MAIRNTDPQVILVLLVAFGNSIVPDELLKQLRKVHLLLLTRSYIGD